VTAASAANFGFFGGGGAPFKAALPSAPALFICAPPQYLSLSTSCDKS
jgi:hypothetical protein